MQTTWRSYEEIALALKIEGRYLNDGWLPLQRSRYLAEFGAKML